MRRTLLLSVACLAVPIVMFAARPVSSLPLSAAGIADMNGVQFSSDISAQRRAQALRGWRIL